MTKEPELILAPIRGITDCFFRTIFHRHFPGFDSALAPFINPQRHSSFHPTQLKDVLPERNRTLAVVPQLLHTDQEDFLFVASRLQELGYQEINWNLGCPAPMVTRKQRGSGLLPFPDRICSFLDYVMPRLPMRLSIKTRLGLERSSELLSLLPRLDGYPLTEIIIHGRLGRQLYRGQGDVESFGRCLENSNHSIVYNGDITTKEIFSDLQRQFPGVSRWMIGRGALANPFLAAEIKGVAAVKQAERLETFHDELYQCYRELLDGPAHLLGRMKQLWVYLSEFIPAEQKSWKRIKKSRTEEKYKQVVKEIFNAIP